MKINDTTYVSGTINKIDRKGYNISISRENAIYGELTEIDKQLLTINEENNYTVAGEKLAKNTDVYPNKMRNLIKKFSKTSLTEQDAIRVAKFIKYKGKIRTALEFLKTSKTISYDNINILIDELLKYEDEDKTKGIEFVIEYEKILLQNGLRRVEEPLYKLLIKHKVKLTKEQCLQVEEVMNQYEEKLKETQKEGPEL